MTITIMQPVKDRLKNVAKASPLPLMERKIVTPPQNQIGPPPRAKPSFCWD